MRDTITLTCSSTVPGLPTNLEPLICFFEYFCVGRRDCSVACPRKKASAIVPARITALSFSSGDPAKFATAPKIADT
jgi:hypothetical protein